MFILAVCWKQDKSAGNIAYNRSIMGGPPQVWALMQYFSAFSNNKNNHFHFHFKQLNAFIGIGNLLTGLEKSMVHQLQKKKAQKIVSVTKPGSTKAGEESARHICFVRGQSLFWGLPTGVTGPEKQENPATTRSSLKGLLLLPTKPNCFESPILISTLPLSLLLVLFLQIFTFSFFKKFCLFCFEY